MIWRPSLLTTRRLRKKFDHGAYRTALRLVVDAVISAEVTTQRARDAGGVPLPVVPAGTLTAVIKTFERQRALYRLVASIQRVQPGLPIIIADDSRDPQEVDGATVISMPFNSGISAGRNAALRTVDTPYFLLLDDDFVFYRRTDLASVVAVMESTPEIDIVGGQVVNLPDYRVHDYAAAPLFPSAKPPRFEVGTLVGGLPTRPKVPNFFVGRTTAVKCVGWTDELKVIEHRDFFTRASGVLTTVQDETFRVLHARNPFDRGSAERDQNAASAREELNRRYFASSG